MFCVRVRSSSRRFKGNAERRVECGAKISRDAELMRFLRSLILVISAQELTNSQALRDVVFTDYSRLDHKLTSYCDERASERRSSEN